MVRDHQTEIAKFSAQAQSGSDPQVMAFAKDTLPTLQAHLQRAQSIQSELKSATQSGAQRGGSLDPASSSGPSSPSPQPSAGQAPGARSGSSRDSGASNER